MFRFRRIVAVTAVLICLAAAGIALAAGPLNQQKQIEPVVPLITTDNPVAADAAVDTSFTYQGRLQQSGAPFTGSCAFQFSLWDAASGGTQQGSTLSFGSVAVEAGLFNVALDFGSQFQGDARWLATAVQCPGDVSYINLTPRQLLTAVPYAHSLRPGALIIQRAANAQAIHGHATASNSIGVWGESDQHVGVYGTSPGGQGVWGQSASGTGVFGRSNTWAGVWGQSDSASGVVGISGGQYSGGVYGENQGAGYGVFGKAVNGAGVYGSSTNWIGVYGQTSAANVAAIRGTNTAGGVAGRFDGTVQITGGADLAERFVVTGARTVVPGTVLVIDSANAGQLVASERPYDTRVVGIASGAGGVQPGLTLHQAGLLEGNTQVAIAGRVYVLAEADSAPIQPGDLLTTSALPGYAMKATDRDQAYGAVLGKALTGLDKGTGLVLVLVTLQ